MFGSSHSFDQDDDDDEMEIPSPPRSARKTTPPNTACCLFPPSGPAAATTTSSAARSLRRAFTPKTTATTTPWNYATTDTSSPIVRKKNKRSSEDADVSFTSSPSIMTMDGRILQSQNPFSSPIVLENYQKYVGVDAQAPIMPGIYKKCRKDTTMEEPTNSNHGPPSLAMKPTTRPTLRPPPTPAKQLKPKRSSLSNSRPTNPTRQQSRFASDFDVIEILGTGCFGTVYTVMSRLDGCLYAVKTIESKKLHKQEVYALAAISESDDPANRHIVRYHQSWMEENTLYIQTELCNGTMRKESQFRPYKLLNEMLQALEFIHRHGMCHLDIKPENIFIKNDQYKLGDFGLVVSRSAPSQMMEEGDARYMSLELLSGEDTSDLTKADIFSLGITVYEGMMRCSLPSSGEEWQRLRHAGIHLFDEHDSTIDRNLAQIVTVMMQPGKRPSAQVLLNTYSFQPLQRQALTRANTWSGASLWKKC